MTTISNARLDEMRDAIAVYMETFSELVTEIAVKAQSPAGIRAMSNAAMALYGMAGNWAFLEIRNRKSIDVN